MALSAVFPSVPSSKGMYESFYLRAVSPERPLGAWIRYTVHKRPSEAPVGSVWCTIFDGEGELGTRASASGPFMHKYSTEELQAPPGSWIRVGESSLSGEGAAGSCGEAGWSLRFSCSEPELRHLPYAALYRAPLPKTKLTSPMPLASFEGSLRLGAREIALDGWHGMVGHNWGSEHAERWIWLHGVDFEGAPGAWIDVAIGRVLVAGVLSPWVANGALSLDGVRMPIGGLFARGLRVVESPSRCSLILPGARGLRVEAHVDVPPASSAGWLYGDPDGGSHDVVNCSIASLTLTARLPEEPGRMLHTPHGCAYELGMRERDHGVPLAPFPDG
jgi:hypothetical protein